MENLENLVELRDKIVSSTERLRSVEAAADAMIDQACDAGYRAGWYDGLSSAVELLKEKGLMSAAGALIKMIEIADKEADA